MCSETQLSEMGSGKTGGAVSRRQFGAMSAMAGLGAGLTACAPMEADLAAGAGLSEGMVSFQAPGGTMDAFFVHPSEGSHPAAIVWPDIAGLRDAFKVMARRLASSGYSVLVLNPYYRSVPAAQFADFEDFRNANGFEKVAPWRAKNTAEAVMETARAAVAWLDQQDVTDTDKGIANQGYCMGGAYTIWTAAAVPNRVKAAASFHGGGLVGEAANSPINLLDKTEASFLIAIAQNDDAKAPSEKQALREAAAKAGRFAEIEVYPADHGWCVPDSPVYNEPAAERAWGRMLAIYEQAL